MRLGIDAVGAAGGIVEAAICYTGDISDPNKKPYTLDYYLAFARCGALEMVLATVMNAMVVDLSLGLSLAIVFAPTGSWWSWARTC